MKSPIVLWGNWLWPSRSNWTYKSKFTPFWAYEFVSRISHHKLKSVFPNLDQKCILALLRSLLILGLIEHDLQFHFQSQTCLSYQSLRLLFICVGLYIFSETIASECSTFHRASHMYGFSYARGQGPTMDRQTVNFYFFWDHRSSMSHRLGNWHWISQAPIVFFRHFIHTSRDAIL